MASGLRKPSSRPSCGCVLLTVLLVLVVNIAVIAGIVIVYNRLSAHNDVITSCVICNSSTPSSQCCTDQQIKAAQYFEQLVDETVSDKLEHWKSVRWESVQRGNKTFIIPYPKPAAHLNIDVKFTQEHQHHQHTDELHHISSWDASGSNAFLGNGVNLLHGCIVVPVEGHYFVYSQVHIIVPTKNKTILQYPAFTHKIRRYSSMSDPGSDLVKQTNSLSQTGHEPVVERSSYASVAAQLSAGDYLCVLVSHIPYIHKDPAATYFGMYLS